MDTPQSPLPNNKEPNIKPIVPVITPKERLNQLLTEFKKNKPLAIAISVAAVLGLLMLVVSIFKPQRSSGPNIPPPPDPNVTPIDMSITPPDQVGSEGPKADRLPLTVLSGKQLVAYSNSQLWLYDFTAEGPRKSLLLDVGSEVLEMSASPDHNYLAFTFSSPVPNAGVYPPTGLKVIDLRNKSFTELVGISDISIRNLIWSNDSVYLSTWNNGQSSFLFDITTKRKIFEIATGKPVGPIIFVPQKAKIAFIDDGKLFESDYVGNKKTLLVDDVSPYHPNPDGILIPNTPLFTKKGDQIVYFNSLDYLVVYDAKTKTRQVLAESVPSRTGLGNYAFGKYILDDEKNKSLVYISLKSETYVPEKDENPIYIYNFETKTSKPFFESRQTPTNLAGIYKNYNSNKILMSDTGFKTYLPNGSQISNCVYTNLQNNYQPDTSRLWSWDGSYFISQNTFQIADVNSCAITVPVDALSTSLVAWTK